MPKTPAALSFPQDERLRRATEFQAVFQRGKREEWRSFVVLWQLAPAGRRVGFAVSRQIRSAVKRNRARRRIREAYRMVRKSLPEGISVVFIGRPAAGTCTFEEIVGEMGEAVRKMAEAAGSRRLA